MDRFGARHADGNAEFAGRFADLGDACGQQVFRFVQRMFRGAPRDGDRHPELRPDAAIVKPATDNPPLGVDRAVLTRRPPITGTDHIALGGGNDPLVCLEFVVLKHVNSDGFQPVKKGNRDIRRDTGTQPGMP